MIKLSDYIFQFLEKKGAEHIFMLPGGGAMHLVDSAGKSGMEYICFLHEQAASIAAEAYGQHTNRPGLLLVTSGPGATNAITGVTAGWIDSTPMFILSGQAKRSDLVGGKGVRQIGSQEVQIVDMIRPVTKYAVQLLRPEEIRFHMEKAWHEATTGRPGPVWLDIPLDVQAAMVEEEKLPAFDADKEEDTELTERIEAAARLTLKLLEKAQKPLVIAGNGIKLSNASGELERFLDALRIPVQTTWKTIDMFDEEYQLYAGHPGIMGDRGANLILQEADLIISIGSRLDTSITAFNDRHFGKNAKKIIVDIDSAELARMDMEKEVSLACDAGVYLEAVNRLESSQKTAGRSYESWVLHCRELRKKFPVITREHSGAKEFVSAYHFIDELCKALSGSDVIVPESSGGAGEITYQAFRIKKGQKMKNAAGLGSMGFGLPYAIGSCIANGGRRTILINGDGAFQLNIQELETIRRLNLPVKMFIWCNNGYASIRAMQRNNFGGHYVASSPQSGLTMPEIGKVAKAYKIPSYRINRNEEAAGIIREMLDTKGPALCEVMVLPEETVSPRVKAYQGSDGQMHSGLLENMFPPVEQ